MNIQDQSVLITGGSRGLGRALGRALATRGANVVLVARDERELDLAAHEIRSELAHGRGSVHTLAFDVGDQESVHRIAGAAAALVGPPALVIHNASTLGPLPMPLLLDTACEDLARVLEVNLVGPFRLTKALSGPMLVGQGGLVLFISSDAAVSAYARWGAYGISKAAQDHLARSLAAELDPMVRAFAIDPGEMDTEMHALAMPEADRSTLARPRDVADAIVRIIEGADGIPNGARLLAADYAPRRGEAA